MKSKRPVNGIEEILSQKKDLIRLFFIATVLALGVGTLGSLLAAQKIIPTRAVVAITALLIVIALASLIRDLLSTLSFQDTAQAVVFLNKRSNKLIRVQDYKFAENLAQTLGAIKAESKAIYSEWERDPLAKPPEPIPTARQDDPAKSPLYVAIT